MTERTTLRIFGAADTITGSTFLLTVGQRRILVDDGMLQCRGEWRRRNWDALPVDPATISDALTTHAHMDHVGMPPRLVQHGFRGPVPATGAPARDLPRAFADARAEGDPLCGDPGAGSVHGQAVLLQALLRPSAVG